MAPSSTTPNSNTSFPPKPARMAQSEHSHDEQDDIVLANYLAPKIQFEQQITTAVPDNVYWMYQQQQYDWSLYQQHYAAASTGPYYYPSPVYYQRYPSPQPQPQPPGYVQQRMHSPGTRQPSPHSWQRASSSSTSKSPAPSSSSFSPSQHSNNNRSWQRSSALLKQQQSAALEELRRPRNHDTSSSRPSSSSSSTTSSVTGASDFSSSNGRRSSITSASSTYSVQSEMSDKLSLSKRIRKVFSVKSLKKSSTSGTDDDASSVISTSTTSTNVSRASSIRRRSIVSLSSLFHKHSNDNSNGMIPEEGEEEEEQVLSGSKELQKRQIQQVLHCSPKLKPSASSSVTSLGTEMSTARRSNRIQFCPTIQVHTTFSSTEYDRRCDTDATCQKLSPMLAVKIKQELNEYKLNDMEVHPESRQYTHFFL